MEALRALRPVAISGTAIEQANLFVQLTDIAERRGRAPVLVDTLFMDTAGARTLVRGGFTLGAHSMSHARMTGLPLEQQTREIQGSHAQIRELQGDGPIAFAYPFGSGGTYSAETARLLKVSGFACALTTRSGLCGPRTNPFELRRLEIGEFGDAEFQAVVSGLLSFPKATVRTLRERLG
jgi:peptidoglycan/xylan/chitin deacetylase (PgdA/CDA1 family)